MIYDDRICEECGKEFTPVRIRQVVCRRPSCRLQRNRRLTKESRDRNPVRKYRWRRQSEFDRQLCAQNGHCYLCPSTKSLGWDHDHSCCKSSRKPCCRRKILCARCNHGVSLLELYDVDWIVAAVDYLEQHFVQRTSLTDKQSSATLKG